MRLVSTRNPRQRASFTEAIQACVPAGGGLYMPEPLPCFRDVPRLLEMDFLSRTTEILHRMLGEEFSREELDDVVCEAFAIPVPLTQLHERTFALELFHGPSLAFQDFGARFLAGMLALVSDHEGLKLRTVLTATLGNTGAATAAAFWKRKGFRVMVLHPAEGLPDLHLRQIATPDVNVLSYAVEGSYDACQDLVDQALRDSDLSRRIGLTTTHGVNIARIVAQIPLFFEAVAQVQAHALRDQPVMAIPCGNGGLLCSGLLAQRMGLPVRAFVAATNANRALGHALASGTCTPIPAITTLSHAMDCGQPSSWERLPWLFQDRPEAMRSLLRFGSLDDEATRKSMWEMQAAGSLPEPHSAVAHGVLLDHMGLTEVGVFLATAHPTKSAGFLRERMNLTVDMPPSITELEGRPLHLRRIPATFEALKNELLN